MADFRWSEWTNPPAGPNYPQQKAPWEPLPTTL